MRRRRGKTGGGPIDRIDEALHLLRRLPIEILVFYFLGAVPFCLVFLFFWTDLSQGPVAPQRIAEAAMGAALAYIWMKFWHAFFASRVREWITGDRRQKWSPGRVWRVLVAQTFIQPWGLLLKPVSLIVPFFFVPVYAFFSIVTAEGGSGAGVSKLFSRAASQSVSNVRDVYQVVFLLILFAVFVFLNVVTLILVGPYLLQVLFAVDTEFMRSGWAAGNSTFFISALVLSYLVMGPLLSSIFILRTYYTDARSTGEDLRVALKREKRRVATSRGVTTAALLAAFLVGGLLTPVEVAAGDTDRPAAREGAGSHLSDEELDRRIDQVLSQREFDWRLPRPEVVRDDEDSGLMRRFVDTIGGWAKEIWTTVVRTAERVAIWIVERLLSGSRTPSDGGSAPDLARGLQALTYLTGFVLIGVAAWLIARNWRKRRVVDGRAAEPVLRAKPDLEDESVTADALPVDEWARLAAEYRAKNEFRLALRAQYMASLAWLGDAGLVTLGIGQSNRDYRRELSRRAHDRPECVEAFSRNCRTYDQAWYGMYPVDETLLRQFEENQKKIQSYEEVPAR